MVPNIISTKNLITINSAVVPIVEITIFVSIDPIIVVVVVCIVLFSHLLCEMEFGIRNALGRIRLNIH